jgi:N-methylhydantoinase A/oxoprolinase/acetone carboxylase beta subunit
MYIIGVDVGGTFTNIIHAIRTRTVQKGLDPRDFSLVASGGGGPLHAAEVAALLDIPDKWGGAGSVRR